MQQTCEMQLDDIFENLCPRASYSGAGDATKRQSRLLRTDLYRAIYEGDLEKAEDVMNLMAMVDIDRDEIWTARKARK